MTMFDDLDPKEFEATAASVVGACATAEDAKARATLLGEAGLIGVIAPESAGGLDLPLVFAVPVASAGRQWCTEMVWWSVLTTPRLCSRSASPSEKWMS